MKYLFLIPFIVIAACTSKNSQHKQGHQDHPSGHKHAPRSVAHSGDAHQAIYDDAAIISACDAKGWTARITPEQQNVVDAIFGTRGHRVQHGLWHAMRSRSLDPKIREQIVHAYGPKSNPKNLLCPPPEKSDTTYNSVGEDFLYMHHQMVMMLQTAFLDASLPCIRGWKSIAEEARDDKFNWDGGPQSKSVLKRMLALDKEYFKNTEWLRSVTLSQLGWSLEITIHNTLHARWGALMAPVATTGNVTIPVNGVFPENWPYDDKAYNWLPDPYGSALNPHFWKIHGYVDEVVYRWLAANGKTSISAQCSNDNCYEWQGTWTGIDPMHWEAEAAAARPTSGTVPANAGVIMRANRAFNRNRLNVEFGGVFSADMKLTLPPFNQEVEVKVEDPMIEAKNRIRCDQNTDQGGSIERTGRKKR